MMTQCLHQKLMINMIKQTLDVEFKHPVILPATLTGYGNSVMCRSSRTIPKGVIVKYRIKNRF